MSAVEWDDGGDDDQSEGSEQVQEDFHMWAVFYLHIIYDIRIIKAGVQELHERSDNTVRV